MFSHLLRHFTASFKPAPSTTPDERDWVASCQAWRTEHWQNFLASPMDARHYMAQQDWVDTPAPVLETFADARVPRGPRHGYGY